MKSTYLLMPLLCAAPVLQSCTTVAGSIASYGMKSVLEARNSSESPEMYYQVGRYAQAQGSLDAAAQAYERALALKSDYAEASNALATVYALQGKYDLASERLDKAVRDNPRAAYLQNNLGYVLYLKGDYAQAIPHLERAVALDPGYARAHTNLALAYGKAGDVQLAGDHNARAVQLARLADGAPPSAPLPAAMSPKSALASVPAAIASAPSRTETAATVSYRDVPPAAVVAPAAVPAMGLMQIAPGIYELRAPAGPVRTPAPAEVAAAQPLVTAAATQARTFRLEVSNGNGTAGMARRVADHLRHAGMTPVRLTNQKPYQRVTEIQYGAGYVQEAAQLAALMHQQALMIRSDKLRPDIKVRLVLGRDVKDETALLEPPAVAQHAQVASAK